MGICQHSKLVRWIQSNDLPGRCKRKIVWRRGWALPRTNSRFALKRLIPRLCPAPQTEWVSGVLFQFRSRTPVLYSSSASREVATNPALAPAAPVAFRIAGSRFTIHSFRQTRPCAEQRERVRKGRRGKTGKGESHDGDITWSFKSKRKTKQPPTAFSFSEQFLVFPYRRNG